jgi:hypothetical protein
VAIGKLIPCLIPYKSIIYLKNFYQEKASFDQIKSCRFKNSGLIAKWHCSPGLGPVHSFPGRPMHSRAAHVHRLLPCFRMAPDTARPVPLSAAPVQLPGRRAPISFFYVAPSALEPPPSSILLSTRRPRADPPCFPLRFGAKAAVCPLSPISSATRESGRRKPPTPPPLSSAAKCPLPGVRFCRPSPEIAEKPPQPHLFGGLRCSPSPSQNGCTSSCSLSLVPRNPAASPLAVGRRQRHRKPAVSPLLRHLSETHHPSPCTAHALWSPLACAGQLLPPRPLMSHP